MPRGLNKVELIGNVGGAPDMVTLTNGSVVAEFSIATNRDWKDRDGAKHSKAEWHNCKAWGKLADVVGEYVVKGMQVYVEGRLETRSWEGEDGSKRYRTEVVVSQLMMLGGRDEGAGAPERAASRAEPEEADLPF